MFVVQACLHPGLNFNAPAQITEYQAQESNPEVMHLQTQTVKHLDYGNYRHTTTRTRLSFSQSGTMLAFQVQLCLF